MPLPPQHRFSVKEYYRMAETGILRPDARVELLKGIIIDRSPISPIHGGINKRLLRDLTMLSNGRWLVSPQNPLRMDGYSEPEPDFMLLKPSSNDYSSRHPQPEDVFLLIEVSDTTLDYDREEKLPAYGRAGIAEVWIVDLNNSTIEVYRDPHFTGYGSKTVLHPGDQAVPQAFPDVVVNVTELFKR
jgi:Uma2 family endonuclease